MGAETGKPEDLRIACALIGGTGAAEVLARLGREATRLGAFSTPFGDSAPIYRVRKADLDFLFMPRHGEGDQQVASPWVNYRANLYALKEHGVSRVLAWSACAAIDPSLRIGHFLVATDLLDETRGRESTFFRGSSLGPLRHAPAFCPEMGKAAARALAILRVEHRAFGVYLCVEGPRHPTMAEVRRYRRDGADVVGMSLCPEAFLARELEMCYAAVCCVTDYAEGVREREALSGGLLGEELLTKAEREAAEHSLRQLHDLVPLVFRNLPRERGCPCGLAMERYRREGRIGEDWHTWVSHP